MNDTSASLQRKPRHACEPCRKKKTKCPAERPACSICGRLNQQCIYLPRTGHNPNGRPYKPSKPKPARARFDRLESDVDNIYGTLQSFSGNDVGISLMRHATQQPGSQNASLIGGDEALWVPLKLRTTVGRFSLVEPEPTLEVLIECIQIYKLRIHSQPLALFNVDQLQQRLTEAPRFLMYSFLSLILKLALNDFYKGHELEAATYYAHSAKQAIMEMLGTGQATSEMVQALCLLALSEILECRLPIAWMTIGTTARTEILKRLLNSGIDDQQGHLDTNARCYWSVLMLERTFSYRSSQLASLNDPPEQPLSPSIPPKVCIADVEEFGNGVCGTTTVVRDDGINAFCAKAVSAWIAVSSYVNDIKLGKSECQWKPDSAFARLNVTTYEWDSQMPESHLLRGVSFTKRSPEEITQHREYWSTWILMQITIHGSQALLFHPFIHLIVLSESTRVPQSRVFQQHAVDQALYHSGWVARLIRSCDDIQYEINDPLIANVVMAIATVPWLFQFARDKNVVQQAKADLATCEQLLHRMSKTWPHISQKLETLHSLQILANDASDPITFKPSLIWRLLDSDISRMISEHAAGLTLGSVSNQTPDAVVRIATRFVHPLVEDQPEQSYATANVETELEPRSQVSARLDDLSFDDLFFQLDPDDFQWLQT